MIRDDYLLRQVRNLATLLAKVMGKAPAAEVEAAAVTVAGLDLDVAERLTPPALLLLLDGPDGLDAERVLALGLGLAARAIRREDARLATTALGLLDAATRRRPELRDAALGEVEAALAALQPAAEG